MALSVDAERYRREAARCRHLAEHAPDADSRADLLVAADEYDRLAEAVGGASEPSDSKGH